MGRNQKAFVTFLKMSEDACLIAVWEIGLLQKRCVGFSLTEKTNTENNKNLGEIRLIQMVKSWLEMCTNILTVKSKLHQSKQMQFIFGSRMRTSTVLWCEAGMISSSSPCGSEAALASWKSK